VSLARTVLDGHVPSPVNRINALLGLCEVLVRRGDPAADPELAVLSLLSESSGEAQCLAPLYLLQAERAWFAGDQAAARDWLAAATQQAGNVDTWVQGDIAVWHDRLGVPVPDGLTPAPPYVLRLKGDHAAAAAAWLDLGCRFDAAMVLLDAGDEESLREAARLLDDLGATATLAVVQQRLRQLGAKVVPRGRRATTKSHRYGLTAREQEVYALLKDGSTNAQIAKRLVISEKTVDHHVSAVLSKLGVPSRREASLMEAEPAT
jgi:ATP/maltotriose-dependent transcriptional regulator MalT